MKQIVCPFDTTRTCPAIASHRTFDGPDCPLWDTYRKTCSFLVIAKAIAELPSQLDQIRDAIANLEGFTHR
jgi:hypothetical protein